MPGVPWLIVPTYDEVHNLEPLLAAASSVLADAAGAHRILVVDDASPDGTGDLAAQLATRSDSVAVMHRPTREGLGPAYLAGFAAALDGGAEFVLQMDADFSHDPADLARLLTEAQAGTDVVLGSRYIAGGQVTAAWHPVRRAVSRAGCLYARTVLGHQVRDLTGGMKCFRASALKAIEPATVRSRGYAFQVEMTDRALRRGLTLREIPIFFGPRRHGTSKMSPWIALEAAWRVPAMRWRGQRPGRR